MADTHPDEMHIVEALRKKAIQMTAEGANRITAGMPGEEPLHEEQVGMFFVRRLPDDPDCLRVSIGEPTIAVEGAYVVIRGGVRDAIELIERALAALKISRIEQGESNSR